MNIRKARIEDAKPCFDLSNIPELLTAKKEQIPLWYFESVIRNKNAVSLVYEEDGIIIGFAFADLISGNGAINQLLAVDPKFRNKGIGKELVKRRESELKKRGAEWVIGYAPKFNKNTLAFHKKNGYALGETMIEILKELD